MGTVAVIQDVMATVGVVWLLYLSWSPGRLGLILPEMIIRVLLSAVAKGGGREAQ